MTAKVKICGLNDPASLEAALDAGADMVGLVFFPKSPRRVTLKTAAALAAQARGRAEIVALSVDAADAALGEIVEIVRPDWLQLHGAEEAARVAEVRRRFGIAVIKAMRLAAAGDLARLAEFEAVADRILFDAKPPADSSALPGGNGLAFDWRLLSGVDPASGYMLSGGLDAENVAEALTVTGARAVDVSSGVEREPGVKDPEKIRAFIAAARGAAGPSQRPAGSSPALGRGIWQNPVAERHLGRPEGPIRDPGTRRC